MNTLRSALIGTAVYMTVTLGALLLLAGCGSDAPPVWTMSPWGWAAETCKDIGDAQSKIGCMREAMHQLERPMLPPASGFGCQDAGAYRICTR